MTETAVILAGGFGTRLQTVIKEVPKPMAPVNGEPFLNYQFRYLRFFGIKKAILSVGHLSDKIREYYGKSFENIQIEYAIENEPLGTGGGIRLALEKVTEEDCFVLNGDSFFDVDLRELYSFHKKKQAEATLALREVNDASRYGTITTDNNNRIISFREKENNPNPGVINGGLYLLNKEKYFKQTAPAKNFSIENDYFQLHLNDIHLFGLGFNGYFIDIGIPEDYNKAQNDFKGFKYR